MNLKRAKALRREAEAMTVGSEMPWCHYRRKDPGFITKPMKIIGPEGKLVDKPYRVTMTIKLDVHCGRAIYHALKKRSA